MFTAQSVTFKNYSSELVFIRKDGELFAIIYEDAYGEGVTSGYTSYLFNLIGLTNEPDLQLTVTEFEEMLYDLDTEPILHDDRALGLISSESSQLLRLKGWKI